MNYIKYVETVGIKKRIYWEKPDGSGCWDDENFTSM